MKKILILTYLIFCAFIMNAQETMYMMKGGVIVGQHVVSEVDSLTFYAPPPPAPIKVTGITLTPPNTVYVGQALTLSTYIAIAPANATDKTVTWSSNNSAVINITNTSTGAATAAGAGSAIIRATANDGSGITNTMTITVSAETPNTYYKGDIPNAKYIGRWVREMSTGWPQVEVDRSYFHGAMIKVNFTGKTAALNTVSTGGTAFSVRIDGGNWVVYNASTGLTNLTPTPLASTGEHTLEIVAGKPGDTGFFGTIMCTTLVLDQGASTLAPSLNSKHIEFIGDSISTICYGDAKVDDHWNWKIAENLGWEHTHLGHPGGGSSNFISGYTKTFTSFGGSQAGTAWNFALYEPDAIVVNLGQNDGGSGYNNFLTVLRTQWPKTPIICLGLFTTNAASRIIEGHVNTRRSAGDSNIHFVGAAEGLVSGDVHPNPSQSTTISNALTPAIKTILGL